jgi:CBS domain-containing protein
MKARGTNSERSAACQAFAAEINLRPALSVDGPSATREAADRQQSEEIMRRLSDIICNQDPLIMPKTTTVEAACRQMSERRVGSVLVTGENGALVGIFTGRDAVCGVLAAGKDGSKTKLAEVMTPNPVTMSPDKSAIDALRLMWDGGFRHVPLVEEGRVLGVVSRGDFKGDERERLDEEIDLWEHIR